jgi:hypothetical protein
MKNAQIGNSITAALYDSGADISCISEKHFQKIPVDLRPNKILQQKIDPCFSAGGGQLSVKGIVNLPIQILGKQTVHPFRIIQGLNENIIFGLILLTNTYWFTTQNSSKCDGEKTMCGLSLPLR